MPPVSPTHVSGRRSLVWVLLTVAACNEPAAAPSTPTTDDTTVPTNSDTVAPLVEAVSPSDGALEVAATAWLYVTFSEPMDVEALAVAFSAAGIAGTVSYEPSTRTAILRPNAALLPDTLYVATVDVTARDKAGNALGAAYAWSFRTAAPPVAVPALGIAASVPVNGATQVPTSANVSVTFDVEIDPATLLPSTVYLSGQTSTLAYDAPSRTVTLTPSAPLALATSYVLVVTSSVYSTAGGALAAPYVATFTTIGPTPTPSAPSVEVVSPADGGTLARTLSPCATFREPLDPTSVDASTFFIVGVAGQATWDDLTKTACFTPDTPLAYATPYTVTLTTGLLSLNGLALPTTNQWSFTTLPDTDPPLVLAHTPVTDAINVIRTPSITVTFSEALTGASVNAGTITMDGPAGSVTLSVGYTPGTFVASIWPGTLAWASHYTVSLSAGLQDAVGNPLAAQSFSFTTEADVYPPAVTGTYPSDGAQLIAPLAVNLPYASFDEPMDATATEAAFTLWMGATPILGSATYTANPSKVVFVPQSPLLPATTYTVDLAASATDLAGNPIPAVQSWSFTTAPAEVELVATARAEQSGAAIAFNTAGDGLAAWVIQSGTGSAVAYSRFVSATSSWTTETVLQTYPTSATGTAVFVASNGSGFMLLTESNSSSLEARVLEGGVFSSATYLGSTLYAPTLLSNGVGYAVLTSNNSYTYGRVYDGMTWDTGPTTLGSSSYQAVGGAAGYGVVTVSGSYPYSIDLKVWKTTSWYDGGGSDNSSFYLPRSVSVASNGTSFLVYWDSPNGTGQYWMNARIFPGAASASYLGISTLETHPVLGSNGSGYLVLHDLIGTSASFMVAEVWDGATWSSGAQLATSTTDFYNPVAVASDGTGYAALWRTNGARLFAAVHNGASFGAAAAVESVGTSIDYGARLVASGTSYAATFTAAGDAYASHLATGTWTHRALGTLAERVERPALAARVGGSAIAYGKSGNVYAELVSNATPAPKQGLVTGTYPGSVVGARAAVDGAGRDVVVWTQFDVGIQRLYGAGRTTTSWSAPVLIDNDVAEFSISSNGTSFVVVYARAGATNRDIYAARSTDATTWSTPALLYDSSSNCAAPRVASNGAGYMAAWSVIDAYASESADGLAWGAATKVGTQVGYDLRLASNGTGYALLFNGSSFSTAYYACIFGGASWSSSTWVASGDSVDLAAAGGDYALLYASSSQISAARYTGSSWSSGSVLSSGFGCYDPVLAADAAGYLATYRCGGLRSRRFATGAWASEQAAPSGAWVASVAPIAGGFIGVGTQWRASSWNVAARSTNAAGGFGSSSYLAVTDGVGKSPRVASNLTDYVATWQQSDAGAIFDRLWVIAGP